MSEVVAAYTEQSSLTKVTKLRYCSAQNLLPIVPCIFLFKGLQVIFRYRSDLLTLR